MRHKQNPYKGLLYMSCRMRCGYINILYGIPIGAIQQTQLKMLSWSPTVCRSLFLVAVQKSSNMPTYMYRRMHSLRTPIGYTTIVGWHGMTGQ